jgi:hypothetical protein
VCTAQTLTVCEEVLLQGKECSTVCMYCTVQSLTGREEIHPKRMECNKVCTAQSEDDLPDRME